jgi:hypothetical protein
LCLRNPWALPAEPVLASLLFLKKRHAFSGPRPTCHVNTALDCAIHWTGQGHRSTPQSPSSSGTGAAVLLPNFLADEAFLQRSRAGGAQSRVSSALIFVSRGGEAPPPRGSGARRWRHPLPGKKTLAPFRCWIRLIRDPRP